MSAAEVRESRGRLAGSWWESVSGEPQSTM